MAAPNYVNRSVCWVAKFGTDDPGYNAVGAPQARLTIAAALADLAANYPPATPDAPHVVGLQPGVYVTPAFALPPNTFIALSEEGPPNPVSGVVIELTGNISLSPDWANNARAIGGFCNVTIEATNTEVIDLTMPVPLAGNPSRTLELNGLRWNTGGLIFEAAGLDDTIKIFESENISPAGITFELHGGTQLIRNVLSTGIVSLQDTAGFAATGQIYGLECTTDAPAGGVNFAAVTSDSSWRVGNCDLRAINLDGAAPGIITVFADAPSIPLVDKITFSGTATDADLVRTTDGNAIVGPGGVIVVGGVLMPTVGPPTAKALLRTFDQGPANEPIGAHDNAIALGYNISESDLYTPRDDQEPRIWVGIESNFPNPSLPGTPNTSEAYIRYAPIGTSGPTSYIEALFFNIDRDSNEIISGLMRGEVLSLANTDGSNRYFSADGNGVAISPDAPSPVVSIGPISDGVPFAINVPEPLLLLNALTDTNSAQIKFRNNAGDTIVGIAGNVATDIFSSGGTAYGFGINNTATTPISFGHNAVEMTLLNGGRVGIGNAAPLAQLAVTGVSSASGGVPLLEITTGTGINENNKIQFGVHDADYGWIQAIRPGEAYLDLRLQPDGGVVRCGSSLVCTDFFTAAPAGATNQPWKFGSLVAGAVTPDTTRSLFVDVGGTVFKVIVGT